MQVHHLVADWCQDPKDDDLFVETDSEGVDQVDADAKIVSSYQPSEGEGKTVLYIVAYPAV